MVHADTAVLFFLCLGRFLLDCSALAHIQKTDRPCNLQNGPFGSDSSPLPLLKYTLDVRTTSLSLAKKQAPVFIIRNICVVIPCAVIALSTGNRISPCSTVFLLRRPHRISIATATTT
ncbi:uncharacterized protein V6R79_018545 [Siganus canaliculatus]